MALRVALSDLRSGAAAIVCTLRRLRLVAQSGGQALAAVRHAAWRRLLMACDVRRRRRHRPGVRAIVQAARLRARMLSQLSRDRERGRLGC